ncbi:hypothetical protein D915_008891 [Fasciola hepatica]|uniref:RNA-polymerase II-associated protein 3-like C-terminal domain-containing protein n=1 Tax=Fasciola hepatica TaxID=6192 RepID=A0A2H1BXP6_FASHE|nr:hypothetical protein D915_008891 [Fasciola hepatica]
MVNLPGAEDQTDREADQQPISVSPDPEWDIVGESCTNPSHVNETNTQNRLVDKALRDAVIQRLQVQDGKIPPITPSVFQTRWISIAKLKKVEKWKAILEIFSDIPSEALPSVIGIKLDALLLDEIIQALDWLCDTEAPSSKILDFTYKTLLYLSQVPRFYCGLLLVSDETIRAVHILLELLENHASDSQDTKWKELPQLKEKYTTGF